MIRELVQIWRNRHKKYASSRPYDYPVVTQTTDGKHITWTHGTGPAVRWSANITINGKKR